MTELYPDDQPVVAALHYITLALLQRLRADVLVPLGGHPPDVPNYFFPQQWPWEPGQIPQQNLRKARYLLDLALAEEGDIVIEDAFPTQTEIGLWIEKNFPGDTGLPNRALGLVEEVGELSRAIVKREQGIRGSYEEWTEEMRKELGDVFIKLNDVAEAAGFDLATCATLRWMDVRERNWVANPQGHGLPDAGAA